MVGAARAPRPVDVDDHVPPLARRAARAVDQVPVDDDPPADAGAERTAARRSGPLRRAPAMLGHDRGVGVVVDGDRAAQALGHDVAERDVPQRQMHGGARDPRARVDERRDAEADRAHVAAGRIAGLLTAATTASSSSSAPLPRACGTPGGAPSGRSRRPRPAAWCPRGRRRSRTRRPCASPYPVDADAPRPPAGVHQVPCRPALPAPLAARRGGAARGAAPAGRPRGRRDRTGAARAAPPAPPAPAVPACTARGPRRASRDHAGPSSAVCCCSPSAGSWCRCCCS